MGIGHLAVGLAAKRVAPRVSLGTLFLSVQLADLVWPILLLLGIERVRIAPGITAVTPLDFVHYPVTHSLVALAGWAGAFAVVHLLLHGRKRAAAVLAAGVLSHWVLDFLTHRPDLPIVPGGPRVGLGLWYSVPATVAVEGALFLAGVAAYARFTRPRDGIGRWAFVALVGLSILLGIGAWSGTPPPSETALAYGAMAQWLVVPWCYWIDRHRAPGAALTPSGAS